MGAELLQEEIFVRRKGKLVKIEGFALVDLGENAVHRVKDGEIEKMVKPGYGFGKQIITWQDDKPSLYEVSYTIK